MDGWMFVISNAQLQCKYYIVDIKQGMVASICFSIIPYCILTINMY